MQAIWKGAISFGLVTIPIKVFSATGEKDVSFRQVHAEDSGRIRYRRVCEECKQEIPYAEISRGYELPDGRMVVLDSEDFAQLPLPSTKSIEVMEFVPIEQVDPIYFAKAYYLAADGAGAKPYVLLRDALTKTQQCALVKVAIRTREALALLREKDGVLVLQTMLWPDEVRDAEFALPGEDVDVRDQERAMAESYIATLENDFDPGRYNDEYRQALEELVEAKSAGLEPPQAEEPGADTGQVVDLVAALRASVDAAKKRRGEPVAEQEPADEEEPAAVGGSKRRTTKKAPAKKAAKKTTKKTAQKSAQKSAKSGSDKRRSA